MSGNLEPGTQINLEERQQQSGWETFARAIDLLAGNEWAPALRLLVVAETEFRMHHDHAGLWRALSGQAVARWAAGESSLAITRATAALLTANDAADVEGGAFAAWQLAVMLLAQGEYAQGAAMLQRAEQALLAISRDVAGAVGAAAVLCAEVIVGVASDPANNERMIRWARDYWAALHPYSAGGAYINMIMSEDERVVEAAYRDNYARLGELKALYDPTNLFRSNQNIKPHR